MSLLMDRDSREDLLERGYSRRQLGRIAALMGAGVALHQTMGTAFGQSQAGKAIAGAVQIGANECWTGPFAVGVDAAAKIAANGNRYDPDDERGKLVKTVAATEGVPEELVLPWPGSGDPLLRTVVSFCSPQKGLVTADPTYEAAWRTAEWLGAPLAKVPMKPGTGADVKAMLAADPNAGLYYICSPNNPTGTVTSLADIEWLLANKPADAVLLVDEAYIHFSEAQSAVKLAAARKDVIVMRTFSKLFGMAGMRLGLTFAHPDLHEKMMRYDGFQVTGTLPMTAVACGNAVYTQADLIKARRAEMIATREKTIAWLKGKGVKVLPGSQANMFMIDWGKPAKDVQKAFADNMVQIGRSWPIWPTVSRISVGSAADMEAFCTALTRIVA
jgi:histidinol-phosphate aminotransferase